MRLAEYLCVGGVEVSNGARVATYVENVGVPGLQMPVDCQCPQLDEGFDEPTGEAPWWEPTRPESADFLGFWMNEAELQPVMSRSVTQSGRMSSFLSPLNAKGRIIQVQGLMVARSAEGMEYGSRWLAAVLRGSPCYEGDCPQDDAVILPACPELPGYDEARYFRHLYDVGLVDGPIFSRVISNEWRVQQASFVLTSSQPWLYHPPTRCLNAVELTDYYAVPPSCALTTPEWMGDGTFIFDMTNTGFTDATNITIQGQISINGTCPVSGAGTSVPPSWTYTIPTLAPEDRIVIDGARRKVKRWDSSSKSWVSGFPSLDFDGPFRFPDVGPCTTMCTEYDLTSGEIELTVDTVLKEL